MAGSAVVLGYLIGTGNPKLAVIATVGLIGLAGFVIAYFAKPIETVLACWLLLMTQQWIVGVTHVSALKKFDVPLLGILWAITVFHYAKRRPPGRLFIYVPLAGALVAGISSAIVNRVPPRLWIEAAFLDNKIWLGLMIGLLLPWTPEGIERMTKVLIGGGVFVGVIALGDFLFGNTFRSLLALPIDTQINRTERGGLRVAKSIFVNPALLSSMEFLVLGLVLARLVYARRRYDILWMAIITLGGLVSLRLKSVVGNVGSFAVVLLMRPKAFGRRMGSFLIFGVAGAIAVGVLLAGATTATVAKYSTDAAPRTKLTSTAFEIAQDQFPFGAGFGRFGSQPAEDRYSPVYYQYGLNTSYGLSPTDGRFLHDTTWATVIGEFGAVGAAFMAGGLLFLGVYLLRLALRREGDYHIPMLALAAVCNVVAVTVDSLGRPALFDSFTVLTVGLIVGTAMNAQLVYRTPRVQDAPVAALGGRAS